jgi:chromosomal replication initiator protein
MKVWDEFLIKIAAEIGQEALEKWVKPLKVVHFDAQNLYLEAKDAFVVNWFEHHLRPKCRLLLNNNEKPIKVHLSIAGNTKTKKGVWTPQLKLTSDTLQADCRFDTFIPGSNENAVTLLKEGGFSPIYLQGPEGAGKTHLLMALTFYLRARGKECLFVKASTLTEHLVAAIRSSQMQKLREFYRKHDVLLVDSVDELADRLATQEELFHTFNTLHLAGKQMVFAGRARPFEMKGVEMRLTSRLEWGLVLTLEPLAQFRPKNQLTPEKVIATTAEEFEISANEILGKAQTQDLSLARQIAIYLCRKNLALSYVKIGKIFSRDHSTIMSSIKVIEKKIKEPGSAIASQLQAIEDLFRN